MSFWANRNSSTTMIKAEKQRSRYGLLVNQSFKPSFSLFNLLGNRHGPEFHGDPERSPVNRGRGGGGGGSRGPYLRQRVSGLVWFRCRGSPLYPGFPAAGCGGRLVSSRAVEKCQSTERADLRSYGNKTNSQSAEASYRRYTVRSRGHLWARGNQLWLLARKIMLNQFLQERSYKIGQKIRQEGWRSYKYLYVHIEIKLRELPVCKIVALMVIW